MKLLGTFTALALFWCGAALAQGRQADSRSLPTPSGSLAIGRHLLTLDRGNRQSENRTLAVAVWYPACEPIRARSAPYFPPAMFDDSVFQAYFATPQMRIATHAYDNAKPCSAPAPLLVFSPGRGVPVYAYSAQFEELASDGYVVAAVQHPFEEVAVHLPDGKIVESTDNGKVAAIERNDVDVLTHDVQIVIDELEKQRKDLGWRPFSGIGVFGHSIGGVVALRSCQLDNRVNACISEDGMYNRMPFFVIPPDGLDQPFMVLAESNPGLSDAMLAWTHMSRAEFVAEEMKPNGITGEMYESGRHGSHLVIIATPDVDHMSFTDTPLLKSASAEHLHTFSIVVSITRSFFDTFLKKSGGAFAPAVKADVAVFTFPARRR
jgi:Platelet-activating factor acetylhydrolase, isoform II